MLGCKGIQQVGIEHHHSLNRGCVSVQHPFEHLGASSGKDKRVDNKTPKTRIQQVFGRLGSFHNTNLRIHTRVSIGQSVCIATLLGCSESWVTYTHLVSSLALSSEALSTFWESLGMIQRLQLKSQRKTGCRSIEANSPPCSKDAPKPDPLEGFLAMDTVWTETPGSSSP